MKLSRLPALAALLASALAAGGCAKTIVQINSKPQGASVYINAEKQGVTPLQKVLLPFGSGAGQRVFIQLVKPGYKEAFQVLKPIEVPDERRIFFTLEEI